MNTPPNDPLELLKSMWGSLGLPMPGLLTPTLDVNELDKRITDLKTVEGWLKTNLGMLQMTIQGLEVQRGTLAAMEAMQQSMNASGVQAANPFTNPALWPWPLGGENASSDKPPASAAPAASPKSEKPKSRQGGK
jgi:hypothetical protein